LAEETESKLRQVRLHCDTAKNWLLTKKKSTNKQNQQFKWL